MMTDNVTAVKDTAAWTLGRVCEHLLDHALPFLQSLVQVLLQGLQDSPRVASNCAWALINLSEGVNESDVSPFFDPIITALMQTADAPGQSPNLAASAYEAIGAFVSVAGNVFCLT